MPVDNDWRHEAAVSATSLSWRPPGSFHHVGFVVSSIEKSIESFAAMLRAEWDGHVFHDTHQGVRVTFLKSSAAEDPLWELVEPADDKSPVQSFAAKGGGLHHVCYVVNKLEDELTRARSLGAVIAREPMPAVAFGGRRIAWIYTRNRLLIEYLEQESNGG
jgi:methylmalonyl-CoA/ethylmalonyl-CoA epimerase